MRNRCWVISIAGLVCCGIWPAKSCDAAEAIRFNARAPQVGDESTHEIQFNVNLNMSIRETGRTIYTAERDVKRTQSRQITCLRTDGKSVQQARVHYRASSESAAQAGAPPQTAEHPVVGKTYLVAREGERLIVTYEDGTQPAEEEVEIVARGMDAVGRPNPLAGFLDGREIAIGQTVKLPGRVARDLFGLGDAVGSAADFEMKLTGTQQLDGVTCGVFDTQIDAQSALASNLSMQISGRFWIETATCRTAAVELSGPVTLSEDQVSAASRFNTTGKGTIRATLRARHGRERR